MCMLHVCVPSSGQFRGFRATRSLTWQSATESASGTKWCRCVVCVSERRKRCLPLPTAYPGDAKGRRLRCALEADSCGHTRPRSLNSAGRTSEQTLLQLSMRLENFLTSQPSAAGLPPHASLHILSHSTFPSPQGCKRGSDAPQQTPHRTSTCAAAANARTPAAPCDGRAASEKRRPQRDLPLVSGAIAGAHQFRISS